MQSFPRCCHKDPVIKASACNPKTRCRESIHRRKWARTRRERTLPFSGDQEVEERERQRERRVLHTLGTNAKGSTSSAPDPAVSAIAPPVSSQSASQQTTNGAHTTRYSLCSSLSPLSLSLVLQVSFNHFGRLSSMKGACASVWPRLSSILTRDGSRGMIWPVLWSAIGRAMCFGRSHWLESIDLL